MVNIEIKDTTIKYKQIILECNTRISNKIIINLTKEY